MKVDKKISVTLNSEDGEINSLQRVCEMARRRIQEARRNRHSPEGWVDDLDPRQVVQLNEFIDRIADL
jgi:hypothetical protein